MRRAEPRGWCRLALAGALAWPAAAAGQAGPVPGVPPGHNAGVPPGANTTDPHAPFFIDLTGLDLSTSPPTRDPANPAYPAATRLPDGALPPAGATGNFILGPTHAPAPEMAERAGVPRGTTTAFTMSSADSVIYGRGMVREEATFDAGVFSARTAPGDRSDLLVPSSRAGAWTRTVSVYVPAGLSRRTPAAFMIVGDGEVAFGGGRQLATVLDNLIAAKRIPPVVAVLVGSGGQDAQGSERGREYDTVSGAFAAWIEAEVLPEVERRTGLRLSRDPERRGAVGGSSSGVAAFTMAWFRPDLYRRVLAYSPTFTNQQWPHDPSLPGGAWEYHSPWTGPARPPLQANGFAPATPATIPVARPLIAASPARPIRMWFEVGDRDVFYPVAPLADGMHDWVLANEAMARALAAKGYAYQFVFARDAAHVDAAVVAQTLPAALEWVWAGAPAADRPVRDREAGPPVRSSAPIASGTAAPRR